MGRALAEHGRRRPDRLRARTASSTSSTSRPGKTSRSRSPCPTTAAGPAAVPGRGRAALIEDFALSPKGERALFVARGDVFIGADREGAHAQPDALLGRARQVAALVARRPQGRVHLRRDRRGGALPGRPGRLRRSPSSSRPAARPCGIARSGRPTASASPSPTRTARLWRRDPGRPQADARSAQRTDGQVRDYTWSPVRQLPRLQPERPETTSARSVHLERRRTSKLRRVTGEHVQRGRLRPGTPTGNYLYYLSRPRVRPADLAASSRTSPPTARRASSPWPCART